MTTIPIEAKAVVTRVGKPWGKHAYKVELYVNEIPTGCGAFTSALRKKKLANLLVDNVEGLLMQTTAYEEVIAAHEIAERKLPSKGDKVTLAVTIGKYPAGTGGTVVRVDLEDDAMKPENTYPVLFCPDGMPNAEIPLAIGEWK